MTPQEMIAKTATTPDGKGYVNWSDFDTQAGIVVCIVDPVKGNAHRPGSHMAARFKLNGKVISRANLEKLLAS